MSIVTISRGSFSKGKEVAEKVAERLGFECLSRDILLEASGHFNIPEIKLERAIKDAPSILERFSHGKQIYVAFIRSALTRHMCQDNIVYHGLAGHVLLRSISHLLKVRILADLKLRTQIVMDREKLGRREATAYIHRLDSERRKWTKSLYGVDPWDPALYDLVLNIPRFTADDAAELICHSVNLEQFKTTAESQQEMVDLALACQIKAALVEAHPNIGVVSTYGNVVIYGVAGDRAARKLMTALGEIGDSIEGINNVEVHAGVNPPSIAV